MAQSEEMNEIFAALALAQGEGMAALKDATGQVGAQKTKYADLASCWDACRAPLAKHGISVIQIPRAEGPKVTVHTVLGHKSGQWIDGELCMTSGDATPRGMGSTITYARRYALCAMVGIAPEDDDGEAASRGTKEAARQVADKKIERGKKDGVPVNDPLGVSQDDATAARLEQSIEDPGMVTVERMWEGMKTVNGALQTFGKLKVAFCAVFGKEVGERMYYVKLGAHGAEHANQFKKGETARACAKEMLEAIRDAGPSGLEL